MPAGGTPPNPRTRHPSARPKHTSTLHCTPIIATPPAPAQVLEARAGDGWIVKDLLSDPFYRFLNRTYIAHA